MLLWIGTTTLRPCTRLATLFTTRRFFLVATQIFTRKAAGPGTDCVGMLQDGVGCVLVTFHTIAHDKINMRGVAVGGFMENGLVATLQSEEAEETNRKKIRVRDDDIYVRYSDYHGSSVPYLAFQPM